MDPVNKWLTTVILFMVALLFVIGWKAGAGRYEFAVQSSSILKNHSVVYVLDTTDGNVKARLVNEDALESGGSALQRAQKVFELGNNYGRRY